MAKKMEMAQRRRTLPSTRPNRCRCEPTSIGLITHLTGAMLVEWLPAVDSETARRPPWCPGTAAELLPGLASHGYTYTVRKSISPSIMLKVRASDIGTLLNSGWFPCQPHTL